MIDAENVPAVDPSELLARFIYSGRHIRASDDTIKPDAFMPHPHAELSVTRHRDATENELWHIGRAIARGRERTLHGRGDVLSHVLLRQDLSVEAAPVRGDAGGPDNPNHANVVGWPRDDKRAQRLLALKIAAEARLIRSV